MKTPRFDRAALLLQGGAQGACHAGVSEGLAGAGRHHTWVVEVSFGAITAALIAGNPPERRVERLHTFWNRGGERAHRRFHLLVQPGHAHRPATRDGRRPPAARLSGWMEPVQVLPGVRMHDLPRPMASGAMQQVGVQGSAHEPPAQ